MIDEKTTEISFSTEPNDLTLSWVSKCMREGSKPFSYTFTRSLYKFPFRLLNPALWPRTNNWWLTAHSLRLISPQNVQFLSHLQPVDKEFPGSFFVFYLSWLTRKSLVRFLGEPTARQSAYGFIWPWKTSNLSPE